jgi:hypothetical protein
LETTTTISSLRSMAENNVMNFLTQDCHPTTIARSKIQTNESNKFKTLILKVLETLFTRQFSLFIAENLF